MLECNRRVQDNNLHYTEIEKGSTCSHASQRTMRSRSFEVDAERALDGRGADD